MSHSYLLYSTTMPSFIYYIYTFMYRNDSLRCSDAHDVETNRKRNSYSIFHSGYTFNFISAVMTFHFSYTNSLLDLHSLNLMLFHVPSTTIFFTTYDDFFSFFSFSLVCIFIRFGLPAMGRKFDLCLIK
jgi:hypothetical protein